MLTQPSDTIWFCVSTKKWQWWKMSCIKKHLNLFVRNTRTILNMKLTLFTITFNCLFFVFALTNHSMFVWRIIQVFWNYWAKLTSSVQVSECITICVSYIFSSISCIVDIKWKRNLLLLALRPSTIYIQCTGTLIPWSIVKEKDCNNIDSKNDAVAHL